MKVQVYHSSNSKFDAFDNAFIHKQPGIWLTEDAQYASEHGANTYTVNMEYNNPIDFDTSEGQAILDDYFGESDFDENKIYSKDFRNFMIEKGFSGNPFFHPEFELPKSCLPQYGKRQVAFHR